jgi:hypothetical protein
MVREDLVGFDHETVEQACGQPDVRLLAELEVPLHEPRDTLERGCMTGQQPCETLELASARPAKRHVSRLEEPAREPPDLDDPRADRERDRPSKEVSRCGHVGPQFGRRSSHIMT